ncbi:hypothetical protein O6H91_19G073900 [Diphasiastrum complanatum]|nr:hypothetical protein O6H91_19G073900 [Diphasiastrum complanatum]
MKIIQFRESKVCRKEVAGLEQILSQRPSFSDLASLLKRCGQAKALPEGRVLHAHIKKRKYDRNVFIGNWLVRMYGDCGSLEEAQSVFDSLPNRNLYSWTLLIKAYAINNRGREALDCYDQMQRHGSKPDLVTFVCALDACTSLAALEKGQKIHAAILESDCEGQVVVGSALIKMYGKCGSLNEARDVFARMPQRDVVLWNTMIAACAQNGHGKEALQLFYQMNCEGIKPNQITYVCALDACANTGALAKGQEIHASLLDSGCEGQVIVGNSLIKMYGKCGKLQDVEKVFGQMHHRSVISWNAMIAAYTQNGQSRKALELFHQMKSIGMQPNRSTFVSILDACTSLLALEKGMEIHAEIVDNGFQEEVIVGTALIKMYSKCGWLHDARSVFCKMPQQDVISWTAMIAAYARNGHGKDALEYFHQMKSHGFKPTSITFVCALDACAGLASVADGREIHASIVDSGCQGEIVVGNALVNMYGKCGSLQDAKIVFHGMPKRNVISWNVIIAACAQNGDGKEALDLYHQMTCEGFKPDHFTFICTLDACASLLALEKGRDIHFSIVNNGCEGQVVVGTALINMYGKCGSLNDARNLFGRLSQRDIVCWNAMIAACTQNGQGKEALELFHRMPTEGIRPNQITIVCALDACASLAFLEKGQEIHGAIVKSGYDGEVVVGNALINMYGKCQSLQDARSVFSKMPRRDIVSWNAMIASCAQNGRGAEALDLFKRMQIDSLKPDPITFVCALDACASLAALETGQEIHSTIASRGFEGHVVVGNALINMYGKCGSLQHARSVFQRLHQRDAVSWNTMIAVYGHNGHGEEALDLFKQMMSEDVSPNQITFLSVLTACSHTGRVDDGRHYFTSMSQKHSIAPKVEHCVCMIDILGRAGYLDEGESLISTLPYKDDARVWLSLLGACRIHGDVERGIRAATQIFKLDPENAATYVLLSNTYAAADSSLERQKVF